MNELKEICDRLNSSYLNTVIFEVVKAEKTSGEWLLTVRTKENDGRSEDESNQ